MFIFTLLRGVSKDFMKVLKVDFYFNKFLFK